MLAGLCRKRRHCSRWQGWAHLVKVAGQAGRQAGRLGRASRRPGRQASRARAPGQCGRAAPGTGSGALGHSTRPLQGALGLGGGASRARLWPWGAGPWAAPCSLLPRVTLRILQNGLRSNLHRGEAPRAAFLGGQQLLGHERPHCPEFPHRLTSAPRAHTHTLTLSQALSTATFFI